MKQLVSLLTIEDLRNACAEAHAFLYNDTPIIEDGVIDQLSECYLRQHRIPRGMMPVINMWTAASCLVEAIARYTGPVDSDNTGVTTDVLDGGSVTSTPGATEAIAKRFSAPPRPFSDVLIPMTETKRAKLQVDSLYFDDTGRMPPRGTLKALQRKLRLRYSVPTALANCMVPPLTTAVWKQHAISAYDADAAVTDDSKRTPRATPKTAPKTTPKTVPIPGCISTDAKVVPDVEVEVVEEKTVPKPVPMYMRLTETSAPDLRVRRRRSKTPATAARAIRELVKEIV